MIHRKRGLVTQGYIITSYMVIMDSYTAGDNQLHDSVITPQLELARTYYNENIFTRVIKCGEWASSRD